MLRERVCWRVRRCQHTCDAWPACTSSMALSRISYTRWCNPAMQVADGSMSLCCTEYIEAQQHHAGTAVQQLLQVLWSSLHTYASTAQHRYPWDSSPRCPVLPMYMPGRLRTGSRPC